MAWPAARTFALIGAFPHEPTVLALMCVIGIGNALVDIGLYTLPPRLVPEDLLARVFGAEESLTALSVAVGSLITPLAVHLLGIRGALVALGLVAPVLAAAAWRRLHAIDASIAHRDEEVEVLKAVAIFRPLPMPAIDELAVHVERARFATGQAIFHQGEHGDRFYAIQSGQAEVLGDGRLIRTLRAGEGFGEIALLHDTLRTTTIRASTPLELYTLDRRHFLAAVTSYQASAREAQTLASDRIAAFNPRAESPQTQAEDPR